MKIRQRKRNEIEEKYKWNLSSMYSSEEEINEEIKKEIELSEKIKEYENKSINESIQLRELMELDIKFSRILDKLIQYSSLKACEDASNNSNQELYGKIINLATNLSADVSFITNKILEIPDKIMNEFLNDEILKEYKFFLEDLLKIKPHILSDTEEKLISKLSKSLILDNEIYDNLTNVDMKFGDIIDEEGNTIELTNSNYSIYSKSKDRNIRKEVFEKFYGTYGKFSTTISCIYNSHLETNTIISKLRKYDSVLDEDLFSDNLPKAIYSNLVDTINDNLHILHKYYDMKREMLKLDDIHIYDINAPLEFNTLRDYQYEEVENILIDDLKILGEDYIEILKRAFSERWIDVYNNEGKKDGAFSSGIYDSNPYILTNFEGKLEDVSAIAHELGHSINTIYSKNNNSYLYYDNSLFTAEVASLTNEIIFNKMRIEKENDKKVKLYIINNLLRLFNSNLFGATLDAEFELDVHKKVQEGEVLTSDYFNSLYLNLNKKYYGNRVIVDDDIKYRWEIYSHLYTDYYLFKYATGISCACYCANRILENDKEFIDKYKDFLKIGSSMYPSDALKTIGIDVTSKEFIEDAINFYDKLLNEFINLYKEIK